MTPTHRQTPEAEQIVVPAAIKSDRRRAKAAAQFASQLFIAIRTMNAKRIDTGPLAVE